MLKFEKIAKIGDYIRAYDFKPMRGRMDCRMDDSNFTRNGCEVFVPMQVSFMEYDFRIMNLSE